MGAAGSGASAPRSQPVKAFASAASISASSKSPDTATIAFPGWNTRACMPASFSRVSAATVAPVGSADSKWFVPKTSRFHSRPRIEAASSFRCLRNSTRLAFVVSSRAASKPGVFSISTNSPRLSAKLAFRQLMVAVVKVSVAATVACVARKSSVSSNSAGGSRRVPPSRTIRAVIAARPGRSAGSSEPPPLNVIERNTSGNSWDGAR